MKKRVNNKTTTDTGLVVLRVKMTPEMLEELKKDAVKKGQSINKYALYKLLRDVTY